MKNVRERARASELKGSKFFRERASASYSPPIFRRASERAARSRSLALARARARQNFALWFQPCTGLLITVKKSRSPSSDRLSSVYFLKHPADEITPIWSQELLPIRKAQRIIWTGSDAKKRKLLCFQLGNIHRLAILDRLSDEEKLIAETVVENNAMPSFYFDGTL